MLINNYSQKAEVAIKGEIISEVEEKPFYYSVMEPKEMF